MRAPLAIALVAALYAAPAAAADSGSEVRNLAGFDRIRIDGGADLNVRVGESFSVTVASDDAEYLPSIETDVRGDTLVIDTKNRRRWRNPDVEVTIMMPAFRGLQVSGATDASISDVDGGDVDISVSGAADLTIDGTCGKLDLHVSGAGDISARDLKCRSAYVRLSGAGDADVFASEDADIAISGVGDVEVYGSPKNVRKKGTFLGSIEIH